jgi:hypothetical protein
MRKFILISLISFFWACSPEEIVSPYPCLSGDCESLFEIDPLVSPGVYQDNNGYWHIEHQGYNYFTIKGKLEELDPHYVINGVPLIETTFDSNYWVWISNFQFTVPLYSVLSYFTSGDYQTPIPVGDLTYTIEDMAQNHPPLNIAGYQIQKNQCLDCPYSETLLGTYSKYTYEPQQQIFFDNEMVGDTAIVMVQTKFNSDVGIREIKEKEFKIIFE